MLNEFVSAHEDELIRRCGARVLQRNPDTPLEHIDGIATFIRQLIAVLQTEHSGKRLESMYLLGDPGGVEMRSDIGDDAALIGKDLLAQGVQINEVVHHYGDVCQAITDLAIEKGVQANIDEYRTLNRCLDNAIAHAVTEFSYHHDVATAQESIVQSNARTGAFLQDLRKLVGTASLAFSASRTGGVPMNGATGSILERTLQQIGKLIDNFAEDLQGAPPADVLEVFPAAALIEEIVATATPAAQGHACTLGVPPVDPMLGLRGNRDLLFAALVNLLQHAFTICGPDSEMTLAAYASGQRIRIDIVVAAAAPDSGASNDMGLALARRFIAANDGILTMHPVDGVAMYAVSLPRHAMPT
jgi:signal transduction histidine kinase